MTTVTDPVFDLSEFRRALGAFVTGVTVVTTIQPDGSPRGFTANSFTSVSLDPPLILVCIAKTASSHPVFSMTQRFAVNVLAEDQRPVSGVFASKSADKFAQVAWHARRTGSPLVDGAAANFDCETHDVVEAGDHIILIGRVVEFTHTSATPLGYCRGAYVDFRLSQEALAASGAHAKVGAILEDERGLMLIRGDGGLRLPTGVGLEPRGNPSSLLGVLSANGIDANLDFLFAVFEARDGTHIYYRGRVAGATVEKSVAKSVEYVPLSRINWSDIADPAVESMLRRYVRERMEDAFGIYVGDSESGTVQPLAIHS